MADKEIKIDKDEEELKKMGIIPAENFVVKEYDGLVAIGIYDVFGRGWATITISKKRAKELGGRLNLLKV